MKLYYRKNSAFILALATFLTFLAISFILLNQIILNNRINYLKNDIEQSFLTADLKFLDSIINQELKSIEEYIKANKIDEPNSYFDLNLKNEKIYLAVNFEERLSLGGYRLIDDEISSSYMSILKNKLEKNLKNNINLNYKKRISVDNQKYLIQVTINYYTSYSKDPYDLVDGKIKRIWIKKDD